MPKHKKRLAYVNQPAEGWYADCPPHGHVGSLFKTKAEANEEWKRHLAGYQLHLGMWERTPEQ